ncbi:hypothetical protein Ddye_012618, partial [Dipteronia dyeriana]
SPKLRVNKTALKRKDIMTKMQIHYGSHAESIVFRPAINSFQWIPSYLCMLARKKPSTMTDFELDDEGQFKFVFFSYAACIRGFLLVIRPVIAIDNTHLK